MNLRDSKRIILIGSAGGGKSTLARQLGGITGIPVTHLDNEFWQPNWVKTPRDQWIEKQKGFIGKSEWILDGNYDSTVEMRFEAADTIIFLDIDRWICSYSVIKRWILNRGKNRPDMAIGCPEKIDFEFIKWIIDFPKTGRIKIYSLIDSYKGKNIIILKNRKEMQRLVEELKNLQLES